jgi:hypothetical protein
LHRLPLVADGNATTVWVGTPSGVIDARDASDVIARLTGKACWHKLFVRRESVDVDEARAICAKIISASR